MKESMDVIVPIFNEEECLDALFGRLLTLRRKMESRIDMSFIFVNDGSNDRSLFILRDAAVKNSFIKVISFSRNFGHQIAVSAGIDAADADYIAIIDADLQDPPELIEDLYNELKNGYDVAYGQRVSRSGETFFKKASAKIFYRILSKMVDINIPADTGDFRMFTRKVLIELKKLREKHRFIRGMIPWLGFKSIPVRYHRDERFAGNTKYPLKKMVKFAADAIFSFSNSPLKVANYIGFLAVGSGSVGAFYMIYLRLFTDVAVPGLTSILTTIVLIGGIQILMLGIIGEYVGRIFIEEKSRPLYIVDESLNIEADLFELIEWRR